MSHRPLAGTAALAAVLVVVVGGAAPAGAHPLGNFTTNTYAGLQVEDDRVLVDYVLDLAEVPAFTEGRVVDGDGDGVVDRTESDRYAGGRCAELAAGLDLRAGDERLRLAVGGHRLSFPAGEASLTTLRLECGLTAPMPEVDGRRTISYSDRNVAERVGWREVTAVGSQVDLVASDVASSSPSDRLLAYPEDRLASPLHQVSATLEVAPGRGTGAVPSRTVALPATGDWLSGTFTSLMSADQLTLGFALVALATALLLGALHAVAPGHGKTIMAAYLVNGRGVPSQALLLGLSVAVSHTAGVVLLGLLLSASETLVPERLYPWLGVASGVLFASVGVGLLRRALGRHPSDHLHRHPHRGPALAAVGAARLGPHDHHHGAGHDHPHPHPHGPHAPEPNRHWRSIMGTGLAGGLVPTPSALVVLLGGIALGRMWFGLLLVLAYGVGMAATLVGVGYALLSVRERLERRLEQRAWPRAEQAARLIPVATAALVVLGGVLVASRALAGV